MTLNPLAIATLGLAMLSPLQPLAIATDGFIVADAAPVLNVRGHVVVTDSARFNVIVSDGCPE